MGKIILWILLAVVSAMPLALPDSGNADKQLIASTWRFLGICSGISMLMWSAAIITVAIIRKRRRTNDDSN